MWRTPRPSIVCKKTPPFSQLFQCLSRAGLGKTIILCIKWRKKRRFLTCTNRRSHRPKHSRRSRTDRASWRRPAACTAARSQRSMVGSQCCRRSSCRDPSLRQGRSRPLCSGPIVSTSRSSTLSAVCSVELSRARRLRAAARQVSVRTKYKAHHTDVQGTACQISDRRTTGRRARRESRRWRWRAAKRARCSRSRLQESMLITWSSPVAATPAYEPSDLT
eukprot:COSAG06_NODE_2639_length_6532_cov_2.597388_3_plen_220_part_00